MTYSLILDLAATILTLRAAIRTSDLVQAITATIISARLEATLIKAIITLISLEIVEAAIIKAVSEALEAAIAIVTKTILICWEDLVLEARIPVTITIIIKAAKEIQTYLIYFKGKLVIKIFYKSQ